MRRGGRGFDRTQRVADLLQKELAQILLQEMSDDRFKLVTITSVTVTKDFSHAKIYISTLEDDAERVKQIIHALNGAAKSIRYSLAQRVDLRVIPELKFVYDETMAHGFKISSLIDSAMKNTKKSEE
jgi:ribosome-binding factor A